MNVQFDREYYVGVVQVVPIIVYDYYEPGEINSFTPRNTEELTQMKPKGFVRGLHLRDYPKGCF